MQDRRGWSGHLNSDTILMPVIPSINSDRRRLKVCHVFANTEGGTWMFEQLRELRDEHGFEVAAVISGDRGPLVDKLRSANIPFHVANFEADAAALDVIIKLPIGVLRLAQLLRRERFDVVQTHVFKSMVLGRPAAWIADVPVRLAMIAGPFHLEATAARSIERITHWMDTQNIPACEKSRQLLREMGVAEKRIAPIIYYGPDSEKFDVNQIAPANIREEYGWPEGTPVICHVAYFYPRMPNGKWVPQSVHGRGIKGHEELVRAAAIVVKQFPEAKFLLVGGAFGAPGEAYLAEIKELVRELQLESTVIFTGFRSDPNQVLRAANVSVQPSLNECCGGSIEALLMESPLVATRVGGLVDTVRDNETGILVRPYDPEDLARGILELLRKPDVAKAMAKAGRKLMLERFTLTHTANDLAALYRSLSRRRRFQRRGYNRLLSVVRMMAGAPVFAWLVFRLILLDTYLPLYFRIFAVYLRYSVGARLYYFSWGCAYRVLGYLRIPFRRSAGLLSRALNLKERAARRRT